jgi:hypothetical protein
MILKLKKTFGQMLNSNDEQNIALATQILRNIEIPEELIAFFTLLYNLYY